MRPAQQKKQFWAKRAPIIAGQPHVSFWPKADTDSISNAPGLPSVCNDVGGPTQVPTKRAMPLDLGRNVLGNLDQVEVRIAQIDRPNGTGRTGAHHRAVHDDLAFASQLRHHFVEGSAGDEAQIQ